MSQPGLSAFPIVQSQPVAWGEMDAFGHVNNASYYRYFESVRISYLNAIGALDHLDAHNPVVAANSCRFLRPVVYPDELELGGRVVELRVSGFRMEYALVSSQQKALVATGEAVIVIVDVSGKKIPLPDHVRQAIISLEATVGGDPAREEGA